MEDAEIRNKTYRHGDKLIVTCHEGFKIRYPDLHNMVSLCRDDGTWDNLPLCQGGCRARVPNRSRGPRSARTPCTGIGVPAPSLQKHSWKYLIVQEIGGWRPGVSSVMNYCNENSIYTHFSGGENILMANLTEASVRLQRIFIMRSLFIMHKDQKNNQIQIYPNRTVSIPCTFKICLGRRRPCL